MRKILIVLIILIFTLSACKKNENSAEVVEKYLYEALETENENLKEENEGLKNQIISLDQQLIEVTEVLEKANADSDSDEVSGENPDDSENTLLLAGDKATISEDGKTITVNNARELVYHMRPGKTYLLEPGGNYDLTGIDSTLNPNYYNYGFMNLKDVVIEGKGDDQVDFMTASTYDDVFRMENSANVTLRNLNLGHNPVVEWSYCAGGVFYFHNSQEITIENCTMYGSGTVGIIADNVIGLYVSDSRIYDCSRNIVELSNLESVIMSGCVFENSSAENLEITNSTDITFKDSKFTGLISNYPNITVDGFYILDFEGDGSEYTIEGKSSKGVRLENLSIKGFEITRELEDIYDGISIELYSGSNELSGEPYTDCTIRYSTSLDEALYLDHLDKAKAIISEYYEHDYFSVYVNLDIIEDDSSNNMGVRTYWDGRVSLSNNYSDLNKVLGNSVNYMDQDSAIAALVTALPKAINVRDISAVEATWAMESLTLYDTIIYEGEVYYQYGLEAIDMYYWRGFTVNARDGAVYTWFDGTEFGEMMNVSDNDLQAVFSYLEVNNETLPDDGKVIAIGIKSDIVLLSNNYQGLETFILEGSPDNRRAEYYYEFLGD